MDLDAGEDAGDAAPAEGDSDADESAGLDASAQADAGEPHGDAVVPELDGAASEDAAQSPEDAAQSIDAGAAADDASADASEAGIADAGADANVQPLPLGADFCRGPAPTWDVLLSAGTSGGRLAMDGDRLLATSFDAWTLWQPSTGRQVASGFAKLATRNGAPGSAGDLLGDKFLASRDDVKVEIRSAADGAVLATFDMMYIENELSGDGMLPRFSNDASYVWQQGGWALRAWSLQGELLFQRSGYYTHARIYAGPNELLIADGPAGSNIIERVTLNGTSSTAATFAGTFAGFFDDDARFLARDSAGTTIYSPGGVPQQLIPAAGYAWGYGELVMVGASIYRIGQALPIATYDDIDIRDWDPLIPARARGMRGLYPYSTVGKLKVVSLLGNEPSAGTHTVSASSGYDFDALASTPDGTWALSVEGQASWSTGVAATPVAISGCGPMLAVAGSASGHVAVATADGLVRIFHLDGPAPSLVCAIAAPSGDVSLSSDGSTLLSIGHTLRLYRLPGGELVHEAPVPRVWALAAQAERVAQGVCADATNCSLTVTDFAGAPVISAPIPFVWGDSQTLTRIALSPNGRRLAILNGSNLSTAIYEDGISIGGSTSGLRGWLGNSALLLQTKQPSFFVDPIVTNAIGETQRTLTVPTYIWFRPIDELQFYNAHTDAVYSSADGHVLWQGDTRAPGQVLADIAGRYRATVEGHRVRLAPWR
jgi:hypothetical protein